MGALGLWDGGIVVASLCAVFGVTLYVLPGFKREQNAAVEYFLAGRQSRWWIIAASLFASNIGTEHFVGQAGAAAYSGIVLALCEWVAAYLLLCLGWLFAPVYRKIGLTTIPQFLEDRFNKYCRGLYVGALVLLYVLSKVGTSVYAGALLMETILGWSLWCAVPVIVISTALYTMAGGLKAVMFTDALQFLVFLSGGLAGTVTSLKLVGGFSGLFDKLRAAGLEEAPHLFRTIHDRDYPWPGMVIGNVITSIAYWCVDQEMAQRVLAGKDLSEVRLGTSTAALLKLIPPFITVFPGVVARALFEMCKDPDVSGFEDWCSADLDDAKSADKAYPLLIVNEFPSGIKGLMVASFIAAMMSSISSVLNSASTVVTYDVYERLYAPPGGSGPEQLALVGRVLVCVMAVVTVCYLPVIERLDRGIYVLGIMALNHLAPPISALFVAGIFTRRTNGQGAVAGFIAGFIIGLTRFVAHLIFQDTCDNDCVDGRQTLTPLNFSVCMSFQYFGILLFILSLLIMLGVSYFYPPPNQTMIHNYTFNWKDLTPQGSLKSAVAAEPLIGLEGGACRSVEAVQGEHMYGKYAVAVCASVMTVLGTCICFAVFH